jgi:hypothetical protein
MKRKIYVELDLSGDVAKSDDADIATDLSIGLPWVADVTVYSNLSDIVADLEDRARRKKGKK